LTATKPTAGQPGPGLSCVGMYGKHMAEMLPLPPHIFLVHLTALHVILQRRFRVATRLGNSCSTSMVLDQAFFIMSSHIYITSIFASWYLLSVLSINTRSRPRISKKLIKHWSSLPMNSSYSITSAELTAFILCVKSSML